MKLEHFDKDGGQMWTVTMQFPKEIGRIELFSNDRTIKDWFRLGIRATMGTTIFLQKG